MAKTKRVKIPKSVYNERVKVAKVLGIPQTKAFIVYDKIICEVIKCKKKRGKIKLDINFRY